MENITGVEETTIKNFKCIKICTNLKDNRDHILRAEVKICSDPGADTGNGAGTATGAGTDSDSDSYTCYGTARGSGADSDSES